MLLYLASCHGRQDRTLSDLSAERSITLPDLTAVRGPVGTASAPYPASRAGGRGDPGRDGNPGRGYRADATPMKGVSVELSVEGSCPFPVGLPWEIGMRAGRSGRFTVSPGKVRAAILVLGLAAILLAYGPEVWGVLGIPPTPYTFGDMRVVTAAAETYRGGDDPAVRLVGTVGQCNYPSLWYRLPAAWGVSRCHTVPIAMAAILCFWGSVLVFLPPLDRLQGWLLSAFLASPSVLLLLERGNNDLIIFAVLAAALGLASLSVAAAVIVVLLAFTLKFYPVFALSVVLRASRPAFWLACILSTLFVFSYIGLTWEDVLTVSRTTPRYWGNSFGANVVPVWLETAAGRPWLAGPARGVSYGASAVFGLLVLRFALSRNGSRPPSIEGRELDAFRIGAAVHCGTFLIGNCFEYRLVFLAFALPQLVSWTRPPCSASWRLIAALTVSAIFVSCCHIAINTCLMPYYRGVTVAFLLNQTAHWGVFLGCLSMFVNTLPPWVLRAMTCRSRSPAVPGQADG